MRRRDDKQMFCARHGDCSSKCKSEMKLRRLLANSLRLLPHCPKLILSFVQVTTSEFSKAVDAQMTTNRETRAQAITTLQSRVLDSSAVQTASIEYIAA